MNGVLSDARRGLFLAMNRMVGARVSAQYRDWLRIERLEAMELQALTEARLADVLGRAVREIPFYRERLTGRDGSSLGDFPILTKDDVRAQFRELMSDGLRSEYDAGHPKPGYSWTEVKTGGSTGVPTTVIHEADWRDRGRASRLYAQRLCGFPFGVPYYRLWGSVGEVNQMRESSAQRVTRMLSGEVLLNAFRMNEDDMSRYVALLNKRELCHMMAYVDAAGALARHIRSQQQEVRPLDAVMACAGTVTEDLRRLITETFGGRVHNKYGSRDCTDMACECEKEGLHIFSHHVWLEIVDAEGNPQAAEKTGRLLVTLLGNASFPLIRYEIGDTGAFRDGPCPCGLPFPLLAGIEGRTVEYLSTTIGGHVSPVTIRHLIGVVNNPGFIDRFQLVQESAQHYSLTLEVSANVSENNFHLALQTIETDLLRVLGQDAALTSQRVEKIETPASGKFLYTLNRKAVMP